MVMAFRTIDDDGNVVNHWEKKCARDFWCSEADQEACRMKKQQLRDDVLECESACSFANDVKVPELPGKTFKLNGCGKCEILTCGWS